MQKLLAGLIQLLVSGVLSTAAHAVKPDPFPEGRWTGSLTTKTIPDVDKEGEWQQEIALLHCGGKILLQFRKEDGTYTDGFELAVVPFRRMFVLAYLAAEYLELREGWIESQVWTLVDARPKGWTLSQSRAVFNQDMKPNDPWYTFTRLGYGTVEYDSEGCKPAPVQ